METNLPLSRQSAGDDANEAHDYAKLISEPLSIEEASEIVSSPQAGATSVFVGTTRDNFEGKGVISLEYEAYHAMALKEMRTVCRSARQKWPQLIKLVIFHRTGSVPVGEASVITAASAPHRRDAIGTCKFPRMDSYCLFPVVHRQSIMRG